MSRADESSLLIERLHRFNVKERYWLVREALGHFRPCAEFIEKVAGAIAVDEPPSDADVFAAMDYHLNWLWAALTPHTPRDGMPAPRDASGMNPIRNNQEDVDLLLAWRRNDGFTQLVLIEAKCLGLFREKQLKSKLERLAMIQAAARLRGHVDMKLLFLSPVEPQKALVKPFDELGLGKAWASFPAGDWSAENFWVVMPSEADSNRWLALRSASIRPNRSAERSAPSRSRARA